MLGAQLTHLNPGIGSHLPLCFSGENFYTISSSRESSTPSLQLLFQRVISLFVVALFYDHHHRRRRHKTLEMAVARAAQHTRVDENKTNIDRKSLALNGHQQQEEEAKHHTMIPCTGPLGFRVHFPPAHEFFSPEIVEDVCFV